MVQRSILKRSMGYSQQIPFVLEPRMICLVFSIYYKTGTVPLAKYSGGRFLVSHLERSRPRQPEKAATHLLLQSIIFLFLAFHSKSLSFPRRIQWRRKQIPAARRAVRKGPAQSCISTLEKFSLSEKSPSFRSHSMKMFAPQVSKISIKFSRTLSPCAIFTRNITGKSPATRC